MLWVSIHVFLRRFTFTSRFKIFAIRVIVGSCTYRGYLFQQRWIFRGHQGGVGWGGGDEERMKLHVMFFK